MNSVIIKIAALLPVLCLTSAAADNVQDISYKSKSESWTLTRTGNYLILVNCDSGSEGEFKNCGTISADRKTFRCLDFDNDRESDNKFKLNRPELNWGCDNYHCLFYDDRSFAVFSRKSLKIPIMTGVRTEADSCLVP